MIERLIFTALKKGIDDLTAEPARLVRFFIDNHQLTQEEAEKIRDVFLAKPPSVVHNYPRADSPFPLFAIVLGDEKESTKFLDDYGGFIDAEEAAELGDAALAGLDIRASIYTHDYHIVVHAQNPDVTVWYYHLVKYFMTRERDFFKEKGLLDTVFSGGDMAPAQEYAPEWIFRRRFTMTCQAEALVYDDQVQRIQSISGAHIDNDVLEVSAKVTPYAPGQEEEE